MCSESFNLELREIRGASLDVYAFCRKRGVSLLEENELTWQESMHLKQRATALHLTNHVLDGGLCDLSYNTCVSIIRNIFGSSGKVSNLGFECFGRCSHCMCFYSILSSNAMRSKRYLKSNSLSCATL